MLTQSRTAFVGVLTVGFLIWVFSEKKLWSLIIILILLIVSWQFAPQQTRERFLTLGSTLGTLTADTSDMTPQEKVDTGSMTARWELINRGFIAFKKIYLDLTLCFLRLLRKMELMFLLTIHIFRHLQ
jgi:hypothetical protein